MFTFILIISLVGIMGVLDGILYYGCENYWKYGSQVMAIRIGSNIKKD